MAEYGPLKLHVPEPAVRPGGTPDFARVRVPRAGSVARPAVDADPEAMRDLAYSIIRLLNRDGEAVGPWAGLLSDEALLASRLQPAVITWAIEAHGVAQTVAYASLPSNRIGGWAIAYQAQAWPVVQAQLEKAAVRLAE